MLHVPQAFGVAPGVRYDFALPERGCFGDRGLVAESSSRGCFVEHIR